VLENSEAAMFALGWRSAVIAVPTARVNKLPNLVEFSLLLF
jgi:hypothetical protein